MKKLLNNEYKISKLKLYKIKQYHSDFLFQISIIDFIMLAN